MYTNEQLLKLIVQHGGKSSTGLSRLQLWNRLKNAVKPKAPRYWTLIDDTMTHGETISEAMNSFKILYPHFEYLGTFTRRIQSPSECGTRCFDVIGASQKTSFGSVMNTCDDRNNCNNGHWVCLFCDVNPSSKLYGIHYYNSIGRPPSIEASEFMENIVRSINNKKFKAHWNRDVHQYRNENCGIFCIAYLLHCASGRANFKTTDDAIRKFKAKWWTH